MVEDKALPCSTPFCTCWVLYKSAFTGHMAQHPFSELRIS